MKTRMLMLAALLAVTLVGAAGVGCKNGASSGPLTLADYLKRVDKLDATAGDRFAALQEQLGDSPGLSALKAQYSDAVGVIDDFQSGLGKLQPPQEAQAAHQELVNATSAYRDEFAGVFEAGTEAQNMEEFLAAVETDAFAAANARFTQACAAIQRIADDNSIDITLDCGT